MNDITAIPVRPLTRHQLHPLSRASTGMSVRDKGPETPPPAPQLHPIFPSKVLEASPQATYHCCGAPNLLPILAAGRGAAGATVAAVQRAGPAVPRRAVRSPTSRSSIRASPTDSWRLLPATARCSCDFLEAPPSQARGRAQAVPGGWPRRTGRRSPA